MLTLAWILLVILIVFLILLLLLLLSPIRYQISASGRDPKNCDFTIQWLRKLLYIRLYYEEGKAFYKEIYILGRMRLGPARDYEEWLSKRIQDEVNSDEDDTAVSSDDRQKNVRRASESVSDESMSGNHSTDSVDRNTQPETNDNQYKKKVSFDQNGQAQETEYAQEEVAPHEQKSKVDELFDSLKSLEGAFNNLEEGWKDAKGLLSYIFNKDMFRALNKFAKRAYKHSSPRSFQVEGRLGLASPFYMGIVAGILYTTWPQAMRQVELDYVEDTCQASFRLEGRIILGVLAWYGLCFVLSKPVRQLLLALIKFFFQNKKYKEESNTDGSNLEKENLATDKA